MIGNPEWCGSGGLQPPEPIAANREATQPGQPSSLPPLATSPPAASGASWSLDTALDATALALSVQTAAGRVAIAGNAAKALLALAAAGSRGLSQPDASAWTAQIGSDARALRKLGFVFRMVRGNLRQGTRTRYVLECQPDIAILRLTPRGGVL